MGERIKWMACIRSSIDQALLIVNFSTLTIFSFYLNRLSR